MRRPFRSARFVCPLGVAALCALMPAAAFATSYTIVTNVDDTVLNANCTLREALRAADGDIPVDACPAGTAADVITLLSATYLFQADETLSGGGSLTVQSQTLDPFDVTIDLDGFDRFLYLTRTGATVLKGLGITGGLAPAGDPIGGAIYGGAGPLEIANFRFVSNQAAGGGGALFFAANLPGANLVMRNGAFISNIVTGSIFAPSAAGAAYVSVTNGAVADLRDVTFLNNSATTTVFSISGGALRLGASQSGSRATCVRCNFEDNVASSTAVSGSDSALGGAVFAEATAGGRTEFTDGRYGGNSATGTATATKVATLFAVASSGGNVALERLFVDFSGGAGDANTHDVWVQGAEAGTSVALLDSQLTFGTANGLVATADAVAEVLLGHLTIADYPLTGANLTVGGGTGLALENSIVALNAPNLATAGKVSLLSNYVGNSPVFANAPIGNYHLGSGSPAIHTGTNAAASMRFADLDHFRRIVGPATDRGCYEFNGLFADNFEVRDAGSWSVVAP